MAGKIRSKNPGSGIALADFVAYFKSKIKNTSREDLNNAHTRATVLKFKAYIARITAKGGRVEDIFGYFDKDKSGQASKEEIIAGLHQLPNFKDISDEEIQQLVVAMDKDESGKISLSEFKDFLSGHEDLEEVTVLPSNRSDPENAMKAEGKGRHTELRIHGKENKESFSAPSDVAAAKELFVRHMRRVSEPDGSIAKLLAYLDDDEDGLISQQSLYRILRREDVFESLPEREIDRLLLPLLHHDQINVAALLRFLEGKENVEGLQRRGSSTAIEEEGKDEEFSVKYDFSRDPETRSLERKLRGFGRIIAKKGMDVEGLFREYDPLNRGLVRRSDLISILSGMGLFMLEKGKALEEASSSEVADVDRILQKRQVQRLKGNYADQAERIARRFLLEGDRNSDFRVL